MRRESVTALGETISQGARRGARARAPRRPTPAELEQRANEAAQARVPPRRERDDVAERARSARERLQALERALAEREGIPPAARALAAAGETLALSALEAEPGRRACGRRRARLARVRRLASRPGTRARAARARAYARGWAASGRRRRRRSAPSARLRYRTPGRCASSPPASLPRSGCSTASGSSPPSALLDARHGIAITVEGHGYDAERGSSGSPARPAEALLLEMDARRRVARG